MVALSQHESGCSHKGKDYLGGQGYPQGQALLSGTFNRPLKHCSLEMAARVNLLELAQTHDGNFQIHELFESPIFFGAS